MSYALSFADRFYTPESLEAVRPSDQPTSLYQAILCLGEEEWAELARNVFHVDPKKLDIETVMDKIRKTDTCVDLIAPVGVWIDEEGDFQVQVYEEPLSPELSAS